MTAVAGDRAVGLAIGWMTYDRLRPTAADSLPALAPEVTCRLGLTCSMMTILGYQA